MPNKDTAIAAEYTLEPAAYRKKARASVVASGAAASTQEIEVLQVKLRRRAEALIDNFIDSKTSCVLYNSFFPDPFLHFLLLLRVSHRPCERW